VLAVNPFAMKDVGYTPQDFAAITLAVDFSNVIVVHPSVPAQSIAEYLALAKGPDGMTYGTFAQQGMETLPGTPQEAAAHVEQERAVWKKVIADAGLRLE
jgi:tripartite-type tricarboxylate transporter receptor subunit TctC